MLVRGGTDHHRAAAIGDTAGHARARSRMQRHAIGMLGVQLDRIPDLLRPRDRYRCQDDQHRRHGGAEEERQGYGPEGLHWVNLV